MKGGYARGAAAEGERSDAEVARRGMRKVSGGVVT